MFPIWRFLLNHQSFPMIVLKYQARTQQLAFFFSDLNPTAKKSILVNLNIKSRITSITSIIRITSMTSIKINPGNMICIYIYTYGCFHFNKVFHYKPSISGYPYFWKHPYVCIYIYIHAMYCTFFLDLFHFRLSYYIHAGLQPLVISWRTRGETPVELLGGFFMLGRL